MARSATPHGASLLRDLASTAVEGERRFDGTLMRPVDPLAQAWLRLAVYTCEASNHLAAQRWVG